MDELRKKFEITENNDELLNGGFSEIQTNSAPKNEINPVWLAGILGVLTMTGLFFTITNWFDSLKIPFAQKNLDLASLNLNQANSLNLENSDIANLLELKQKDTDGDGLTDYDELYLHKTSPYIPDSDSDGYPDGQEVQNGQNPNCPAGLDCAFLPEQEEQALDLPITVDSLTAEQIRSILLSSGVSQQELEDIDDETLKTLYQEVLTEAQSSTAGSSSSLTELEPADFEAVTPDQLRLLLKDQGLSEEDLNDLTDEDLRELWQLVIEESQNAAGQ